MIHKRIAIVQSSYIPWKGYFDLIRAVDEFVLLDDVQYTRRDWRNRNRIKTSTGPLWLTIPVIVRGRYRQTIKDTCIEDPSWAERHWRSITASYARAAYFAEYRDRLHALYTAAASERYLSRVNYACIRALCDMLQVPTRISWSMDYAAVEGRTERLVGICEQAGATEYLSGPSARAYIDLALFERAGITVTYVDYSAYPEYEQLYPPFDHRVSILDLLLTHGSGATDYMLSF